MNVWSKKVKQAFFEKNKDALLDLYKWSHEILTNYPDTTIIGIGNSPGLAMNALYILSSVRDTKHKIVNIPFSEGAYFKDRERSSIFGEFYLNDSNMEKLKKKGALGKYTSLLRLAGVNARSIIDSKTDTLLIDSTEGNSIAAFFCVLCHSLRNKDNTDILAQKVKSISISPEFSRNEIRINLYGHKVNMDIHRLPVANLFLPPNGLWPQHLKDERYVPQYGPTKWKTNPASNYKDIIKTRKFKEFYTADSYQLLKEYITKQENIPYKKIGIKRFIPDSGRIV